MLGSANLGTQQTHGPMGLPLKCTRCIAMSAMCKRSPTHKSSCRINWSLPVLLSRRITLSRTQASLVAKQTKCVNCRFCCARANRRYPLSPTIATQVLPSICCRNVITSKYSPKPRLAEPPTTLSCTKYSCRARHPENVYEEMTAKRNRVHKLDGLCHLEKYEK